MDTIGQLAAHTGTSPRMLRHWEALGLLEPATVDTTSRRRLYAPSQAGRIRAIVELRALGFGLGAIRDLLDQGLTQERLVDLLRQRESEILDRMAVDADALAALRQRLASLEQVREAVVNELLLAPLTAVRMHGVVTTAGDETEIPLAVAGLLARLGVEPSARDREVMLAYDGESNANTITVAAALEWTDGTGESALHNDGDYTLPHAPRGVIARLEHPTGSTADAWIALDAAVAEHGLTALGPYRQILHADGGMTLAAPVRDAVH